MVISFACHGKPLGLKDSIEVVFKDTIHVHGKVVDEKGNPLKAVAVSTGGYFSYLVWTNTNAQGDYLLKNVQPNDTIFFRSLNRMAKIYPEGSRTLNVVLSEQTRKYWVRPIVIAKRQRPKELKTSTIKYDNTPIFITYDSAPEVIGGVSEFHKNLNTKISYPEKAQMANIEGMVNIQFVIDPEGTPTDFNTIQGLGYGCEEAVIEVLKATKWRPGLSNGYPVSITTSVKVLFKLEES